jgi:hypothetical protein
MLRKICINEVSGYSYVHLAVLVGSIDMDRTDLFHTDVKTPRNQLTRMSVCVRACVCPLPLARFLSIRLGFINLLPSEFILTTSSLFACDTLLCFLNNNELKTPQTQLKFILKLYSFLIRHVFWPSSYKFL